MRSAPAIVALAIGYGCTLPLLPAVQARNHGAMGQTWPVEEPDLLATIEGRLRGMEANGGIERMQQALVAHAKERIHRPTPVAGVTRATAARRWAYDPSIVVENDIRDQKGNLIAARGRRVNPLDFVQLKADLVFVDGDDPEQLAWATKRYAPFKAKIIFVAGSPFERMKEHQRRFYFDQRGELTAKFGIEHTPAIVRADGALLAVEEVVLPGGAAQPSGGRS